MQNETFLVVRIMVIGIVTTLLKESARTLKDTHAIRQLHCQ